MELLPWRYRDAPAGVQADVLRVSVLTGASLTDVYDRRRSLADARMVDQLDAEGLAAALAEYR